MAAKLYVFVAHVQAPCPSMAFRGFATPARDSLSGRNSIPAPDDPAAESFDSMRALTPASTLRRQTIS